MRAEEKQLTDWIDAHEREMKEDIAALVRIPSVADSEGHTPGAPFGAACREALDTMREMGERYGFDSEDTDGYCLSLSFGEGSMEIGIWNHLDVVPAGEGWTFPPYELTEKNGYLIGRGVQDNKGPAVAVLYALRFCREHGLLSRIRVKHLLGCEEESGMGDVAYYLEHRRAPDFSFVADCGFPVCCGEKGHFRALLRTDESLEGVFALKGGTVCNSVPSYAAAYIDAGNGPETVTAEGTGGHAAFPDGTVSAVWALSRKLSAYPLPEKTKRAFKTLELLAQGGYGEAAGLGCRDALSGRLTCNVGIVTLEKGKVLAALDIRYPVTLGAGDFLPALERAAEAGGFRLDGMEDSPPYYFEKSHPFVQILMSAWEEETGKKGEAFVMGGGTYARKLPDTVAFGPGSDRDFSVPGLPEGHGNCHCADEAECMDNLKKAIRIYVRALVRLDEQAKSLKAAQRQEREAAKG